MAHNIVLCSLNPDRSGKYLSIPFAFLGPLSLPHAIANLFLIAHNLYSRYGIPITAGLPRLAALNSTTNHIYQSRRFGESETIPGAIMLWGGHRQGRALSDVWTHLGKPPGLSHGGFPKWMVYRKSENQIKWMDDIWGTPMT
jgi:hypothetical protein